MRKTKLSKTEIALVNLLIRVTREGKPVNGSINPYCVPEVSEALKAIANKRGIADYFDALVDLENSVAKG